MAIQIKEVEYLNFGRCVHMSNGIIEVMVTIDVGPRLIHFGLVNGENMLYTDTERKHFCAGPEFDELYGEGSTFYLYGGHRLWLSPELVPETYFPDNDPVIYAILPDGVSFTPAKQPHTEIQLGFEVMMNENASDIMVVHSAKNLSKDPKTFGLWAVTMLAPGGIQIIPQNESENAVEPNRLISLWPYSKLQDPRVYWGDRFITLQQDPTMAEPFKAGWNNQRGWAAYAKKNVAFLKHYVHNAQAVYPDNGASCEVYMVGDYTELETLSPLYHIEPGDTVRHVENLTLLRIDSLPDPKNEDALAEFTADWG